MKNPQKSTDNARAGDL